MAGKRLTRNVAKSHTKARAELHKSVTEHNNKVLQIGSTKMIDNHRYTLKRVETSRKDAEHLAEFYTELNKIKGYRILTGEYGYYLWVR
jgi:hypothetical protein